MSSAGPVPGGVQVVTLFGTHAVGKSTLGAALGDALPCAALLSTDDLRYQMRGGLVAWSRGTSPDREPAAYRTQCLVGVELALAMTRCYLARGITVLIEALEDECIPGGPWAEWAWAGLRPLHLLLWCEEPVLAARWRERGRDLQPADLDHQRHLLAQAGAFDAVVDTGSAGATALAAALAERITRGAPDAPPPRPRLDPGITIGLEG